MVRTENHHQVLMVQKVYCARLPRTHHCHFMNKYSEPYKYQNESILHTCTGE